jgi:hypothetical protein
VEKLVGVVAVRRPPGTVAFEANTAECPDAAAEADPAWSSSNARNRTGLLRRLCADEPRMDFSLEGMLRLFRTHAEPAGLCQHGPALHSWTGFFMLPRKRELHIARGYTCEGRMEVVRF